MANKGEDKAVATLIKGINFQKILEPKPPKEEKKGITYWVKLSYKKRYAILQEKSGGGFGREIERLILKAIDVAMPEESGKAG